MALLIAPAQRHLKLLRRLDEPALVTKFLGDSLLGVGFADDKGRYVDTHGQPIQLPPVGSRRVATVFERDVGRPVIVHHRSLLTDGLLMDAISSKPGSQLRMLGQRGDASPTGPTSLLRDTAC